MSIRVAILNGPIEDHLPRPPCDGCGACLTFLGIVRAVEQERPILGLRYETYDPMAQNMLEEISRQAISRFSFLALELLHSRGFVPVGAVSLFIAIGAKHRKESLAAMDWLIDRLKKDVPIWKRPVFRESVER